RSNNFTLSLHVVLPICLSYVKKAVCFPTNENLKKVDEAFKEFYGKVRILTYLSNMIYYNAINYDRKIKKDKDREMLILDKPLKRSEEHTSELQSRFDLV